ncbi:MAG TPA: calcium-binding protein [Acetobacteraceae bacterium]|nr:calcium-binding protein [Acetobacteraceae bacterium]
MFITGTDAADAGASALVGDAADETIEGLGGADELFGNRGQDRLLGGAGSDTLRGGSGADLLDGGADSDWASYEDEAGGVQVDLEATSVWNARGQASTATGTDTITGVEYVRGSAHADTLVGDNSWGGLFGLGGDDTLSGRDANDKLEGGDGNDSLDGGNHDDTLVGGAGDDVLHGGGGTDRFTWTKRADGTYFDGEDVVKDFTPGAGGDYLRFVGTQDSSTWDTNGDRVIDDADAGAELVPDVGLRLFDANGSVLIEGVARVLKSELHFHL